MSVANDYYILYDCRLGAQMETIHSHQPKACPGNMTVQQQKHCTQLSKENHNGAKLKWPFTCRLHQRNRCISGFYRQNVTLIMFFWHETM